MYDSVFVFAIGLQTLEQSHTLKLSNVSCDKEQPWDGGLSLINYINAVSMLYTVFLFSTFNQWSPGGNKLTFKDSINILLSPAR